MNAALHNVNYALRKLAKSPGFTILAVGTLALGIGLNSAIFSVVNALLFRPLPVEEPSELVSVYNREGTGTFSHMPMAFPDYLDLAGASRGLTGLAAYTSSGLVLEHGEKSEPILGEVVTGNYFELLGVKAVLGRTLVATDDLPGEAQKVAVLSHRSWQRRFGGDRDVLGLEIRVNGHPFTVVGVAQEGFFGMLRGVSPEVWVPIRTSSEINAGAISNAGDPTEGLDRLDDRARRWHYVVGRRAPGVTLAQASQEITTLNAHLQSEYPATNEDREVAVLATEEIRLFPGFDATLQTASLGVMAIVAMVLLIACANLANMLLARAVARRKEIATRLALGASRWAVIRQLLIESLTLALLGGGTGLALAGLSNALLDRISLPLPVDMVLGLALDTRVVVFTLVLSSLAAVAFGLAPAFEATRANLSSALTQEARGSSSGVGKKRLRDALVVAQVALSLVLLICAGLAVRSMQNAHRIDPGFDPEGLVTASFAPMNQGYSETDAEQFYERLKERVQARPGIEAVAFASHLPLTFNISFTALAAEGRDSVPEEEWPNADTAIVGPDFHEAMGVPLLRGRSFSTWDDAEAPRVAVINETLASRLWPGEEAIGRRLRTEGREDFMEVVGVVADGKYRSLGEEPRPFLYRAMAQDFTQAQTMVVRTRDSRAQTLAAIRQQVRELDENLVIGELATIEEATASALVLPRAGAALFGLFGVIGLALAVVGLYGVVSYLVSQRTHEIGIRVAMGAKRWDILGLMLRQGMWLTAIGVGLGLAAASGATRVLSSILYGISATDIVTFAGVSLLLTAVALVATVIPARRASRMDPIKALRSE